MACRKIVAGRGRGGAYAGAAPPRQASIANLMEEQRQALIAKFGREPGPDDPVIFDPDHDTPRETPEKKVCAQTFLIMLRAGTPEHLIYAYLRTGASSSTPAHSRRRHPTIERLGRKLWQSMRSTSGTMIETDLITPRARDERQRKDRVAGAMAVDGDFDVQRSVCGRHWRHQPVADQPLMDLDSQCWVRHLWRRSLQPRKRSGETQPQ